ncbi:hypothetical protein NW759_014204 [Fusarium solani]|uniref:GLEYA domain-containing protein n=2 Tax=Fusarium solani TaxID=169388 RepID=A0A9P9HK90_FUSSL|nr:GLEYA domain-containing protein [Fusarium solani]KAH7258786.1 GLEYA domain-containing protein [Fusarium solani]KAJ4206415.1 hypothetical protein NW759_014204 [Fusarium solani]
MMVNAKRFIAALACASLTAVQAGPCRPSTTQSTDTAVTSSTESVSSSSAVISSVDTTTELTSTTEVSTSVASSTSELATTTTTAVETTSSASTTVESTTTTATACPTPISCDNLGFDWAYYSNPAQNTDTTYSNFHPDSFKRVNPLYVGTTPYVGGLYQPGSENAPGPIYGSATDLSLDYFALNHHGYIYACETGTYQFNIPYANDAVYLWLGAKAYAGWSESNADAKARYNQPDHIAGSASFSITVPAGAYVPIRFVYGQAQYGGGFYFTITTPNGQVIASNEATASPYVVRYSCDNILAPRYPAFGQEF